MSIYLKTEKQLQNDIRLHTVTYFLCLFGVVATSLTQHYLLTVMTVGACILTHQQILHLKQRQHNNKQFEILRGKQQ